MKTFMQVLLVACFLLTAFKKETGVDSVKLKTRVNDTLHASVDELAFLTGNWKAVKQGVDMEEHWTAPLGNNMMSLQRLVKRNEQVSFRTLSIEESAKGPVLQVGTLVTGKTPKRGSNKQFHYHLDTLSTNRAVFVTKDSKRLMIYERLNDTELSCVRIEKSKRKITSKDSCVLVLTTR